MSATTGSTITLSTPLDLSRVREAVVRATHGAGRWWEPRLSPSVTGESSIHLSVARPLEHPTRVRVSWGPGRDGASEVRLVVRHAAGLSAGSRRLINRFVTVLAAELECGPQARPLAI